VNRAAKEGFQHFRVEKVAVGSRGGKRQVKGKHFVPLILGGRGKGKGEKVSFPVAIHKGSAEPST